MVTDIRTKNSSSPLQRLSEFTKKQCPLIEYKWKINDQEMNQGRIERSSLVFKNCLVTTFRIQATLLLLAMLWDKQYKNPTAYDRRRSANNLGLLPMYKLNVHLKLPCHRPCGVNVPDVILSLPPPPLSLSLFTCNYCIFWWRCAGVIYAVILLTVCYLSFWNVWTTKRLLHVFPTPVHSVICNNHIHHILIKK